MTSVETVSALERRLSATIPQQEIEGVVSARLKNIGRSARIAGFRPGKVPAKVVEQFYGTQARQEALSDALQRSFAEAAQINNLRVAGAPQFDVKTKDLKADQIEYSATFEVYPEVELNDLSSVKLVRLVYQLGQEDVDNTIETLRKQRAVYHKVERAAQNTDRVNIDFTGKLNGEIFKGGEAKGLDVVLGSGSMLADFEKALVGMQPGETKSFDMTFPPDYHSPDLAGKQVNFSVTVHTVEAAQLPEVDAEFARSMGIEDGDIAKLQEEIRGNLSREVSRRMRARNKDTVMEALLNSTNFEVPRVLLEEEINILMKQTVDDMESRGVKMKGMPLHPDLFRERAERRVKLGLILGELMRKHDFLKAKQEQVDAMIEEYAQGFEESEQIIQWYRENPERTLDVENLALEENVVDWVLSQAQTDDKPTTFAELMSNG